jgi:hypothetical protein
MIKAFAGGAGFAWANAEGTIKAEALAMKCLRNMDGGGRLVTLIGAQIKGAVAGEQVGLVSAPS